MHHTLHIIHVGKHSGEWYSLGNEYIKRMSRSWHIQISTIKDASSSLSIEERKKRETQKILPLLTEHSLLIELHPEGTTYSSLQFAQKMSIWCENRAKIPTFLLAGTFGFAREQLPPNRTILSLSPMTFTHEMTYALLLEQIYRSYTLLTNIPYHY
ncbi:MAG: 23S rRNA (pseudouridine(1915)-N(3))-methyltransferase RlmH [Desulfovibrionaceae bacterium]|nr:23S rRNA (pseudouridine(1915)-N(3))-methyltransferase RlmH [Desulfovibrionaceae bacterium]